MRLRNLENASRVIPRYEAMADIGIIDVILGTRFISSI